MKSYFVRTPKIVQHVFYQYDWRVPTKEKEIYLTFDDGPVPEFTPWVLDVLRAHNAEATFFCVGDNIRKHPEIFHMLRQENHSLGNHTHNHLVGWKTPIKRYVKNVLKAEAYLRQECRQGQKLFRPPHGRIRPIQAKILQNLGYKIVMWDVLSGDFDQRLSKEACLEQTLKSIRNGSIVVFHDSMKCFKNLDYVLPRLLKSLSDQGYSFKSL